MIAEHMKYAADVVPALDTSHNYILFGRREVGKTTFFFHCIMSLIHSFRGKIIVIDSATAHIDKSLIIKIKQNYTKINWIEPIDSYKDDSFEALYKMIDYKIDVITLIDASKYLEYSYEVEGEQRQIIRDKYKDFVETCISIICETFNEYLIIMDEIELTSRAVSFLNNMKERGAIFAIIHDISYIEGLENYVLFNVDRLLLDFCNSIPKGQEQLCGNACAEIVSALFYTKEGRTNVDLFWCSDIAYYLAQKNIVIEVSCWKSTLYSEYILDRDCTHPGFVSLKRYESDFSPVSQTPITYSQFLFELDTSKCIICCVSSSIFNNDCSLTGGHFVVVYKDNGTYCCLTPKKNCILKEYRDINLLVNACSSYGGWRILCK